jgi:thymidylate synthase
MKSIRIICCVDNDMGIGKLGSIPWPRLKSDLKHFKSLTNGHTVIMGRKTYESLPKCTNNGPLPGRKLAIISKTMTIQPSNGPDQSNNESEAPLAPYHVFSGLDQAIRALDGPILYIIGGQELFKEAINHPLCQTIYLTTIIGRSYDCDVFFPATIGQLCGQGWRGVAQREAIEGQIKLHFYTYERQNVDEIEYLNLLAEVASLPTLSHNRTNIKTKRAFSRHLAFDLADGNRPVLPLLTTKKMAIESIIHELIWFLSGQTNIQYLKDNGIHIWDANTSRQFLDNQGLIDYPEGELGPGYGYQWRHFGRPFGQMGLDIPISDHLGPNGIDQIANLIEGLKSDPFSRRHVLTAWNPTQLGQVALPPCHCFVVFYVSEANDQLGPSGILSCHLTMRSGDLALGVPFNIASYSLLTHILCHLTNLAPGQLHITIVDTHVYENHTEGALIQANRAPVRFPTVRIDPNLADINKLNRSHISVINYYSHPAIKLPMAE